MIALYRGHTITVTRERSMGGDVLLYLAIVRDADSYLCMEAPYSGSETVREMVRYMKQRVDAELRDDDPWGEQEEAA